MRRPTRKPYRGRLTRLGKRADEAPSRCAGVVAAACTQRKTHATREAPRRAGGIEQPEAREGSSGRCGVTERLVVLVKPGNAGGGKGPWFRTDATRSEGAGIGQPSNSGKCSETADGVTRESEDGSRVPLLCAVRQDLPGGYPGPRLCPVPLE